MSWSAYTYMFSLTHNPAASIPCGTSSGLPIGAQIVAPNFGDAVAIMVSDALAGRDR